MSRAISSLLFFGAMLSSPNLLQAAEHLPKYQGLQYDWNSYHQQLKQENSEHSEQKKALPDSRYFLGFDNFGNTCFLNGALKLLAADTSLLETLQRGGGLDTYHNSPKLIVVRQRLRHHLLTLLRQLQRSAQVEHKELHYCRLMYLLKQVCGGYREAFMLLHKRPAPPIPGPQQDPQEFIQRLLEFTVPAVREGCLRPRSSFSLLQVLKWEGEEAARIIDKTNNFFLSVPVKSAEGISLSSVQEAVDAFFAREQVSGGKTVNFASGEKELLLASAPPALHIQLNRFAFDQETMAGIRLAHPVKVAPISLIIHDAEGKAYQRAQYAPLAVEVHQTYGNSLESGHYYTYIRGQQGWFCHNDAQPPVLRDNAQRDIDRNAYLLKYSLQALEEITP